MKNSLKFLIILTLVGFGCNNHKTYDSEPLSNNSIPNAKTEFTKLNDFQENYEVPSQIFKVPVSKPTKITGKLGTIISLNPDDLTTENGQPIGRFIEIELKELVNQEQLLRANASTMSERRLLVSGGAYYINMTSDGQQLKLKDGKSLSVEFPKITSEEMTLFYGQRDTLGQLNWLQIEQKLKSKPKQKMVSTKQENEYGDNIDNIISYLEADNRRPLTEKEKKALDDQKKNSALENKLYEAVELIKLGWINCDRFYDAPNKTNLQYAFNKKDSIISANIYLVFKDINSVMQDCYFSFDGKVMDSGFKDIPVGAKTQLIAFSVKNGKTYSYKSDLTIKTNETIQLTLKETSQDQIKKIFQTN